MAGMWELPQSLKAPEGPGSQYWRKFRHSITTTNYTVHVVRYPAEEQRQGTWIALQRIPELPITGMTRKILKADGII
jgi:adenine-specific DNA glycosylase